MVYIAKALLILSFALFASSAENGCQTLKKVIEDCHQNDECIAKGIKLLGDDGKVNEDKAYAFFQPYVVNQTSFDEGVAIARKCAEGANVNHDNPTQDEVKVGLFCLLAANAEFKAAFGCEPLVEGPWG